MADGPREHPANIDRQRPFFRRGPTRSALPTRVAPVRLLKTPCPACRAGLRPVVAARPDASYWRRNAVLRCRCGDGAVTRGTLSGERPAGPRTTRAEPSEARTTLRLPS